MVVACSPFAPMLTSAPPSLPLSPPPSPPSVPASLEPTTPEIEHLPLRIQEQQDPYRNYDSLPPTRPPLPIQTTTNPTPPSITPPVLFLQNDPPAILVNLHLSLPLRENLRVRSPSSNVVIAKDQPQEQQERPTQLVDHRQATTIQTRITSKRDWVSFSMETNRTTTTSQELQAS